METQAFGINNRGQVVGQYLDASGSPHGYRWDKGRFTTIDVPDGFDTSATNINDRGEIVRQHVENAAQVPAHGFLLSKGVLTTFDAPGGPIWFPPASTTAARSRAQRPAICF